MKITNPDLREKLAAEYVLGTMPWRARLRFQLLQKSDPKLRQAIAQWEQRLSPLAHTLQEIAPPARVWRAIQARVRPGMRRARLWHSIGFWRVAAAAASVAFISLATVLLLAQKQDVQEPMMVVVMTDTKTNSPAMTVSWEPGTLSRRPLRVRVIGHAEMAPDSAWELWMLRGSDKQPVSLGLIGTQEMQSVHIPKELAEHLETAWGLAMSVEPAGGSPTGVPTGPVLYAGQCVKA